MKLARMRLRLDKWITRHGIPITGADRDALEAGNLHQCAVFDGDIVLTDDDYAILMCAQEKGQFPVFKVDIVKGE